MTTASATDPTAASALDQMVGRMLAELGAAFTAPLVVLGDRLGFYKALARHGPLGAAELALLTETDARYVREWLSAQAAAGYVTYAAEDETFALTPKQALVFADESSPVFMAGAFEVVAAMFRDEPRLAEAFRNGRGVGWHEHDACLFRGTARFFRAAYLGQLVQFWLPALDGVVERLAKGGRVADIGCGHGHSTLLMAEAFPRARFTGFDYHPDSIAEARRAAEAAGIADRVRFEVASAKDFPGTGYDLVTVFDALHDFGDPVGAAAHVRQALAPDGTWMVVEPFANDRLEDNLNPVSRMFYAASTMVCTPASRSQEVGLCLGAQAGEARLRKVLEEAGFTRIRRAAATPFNLLLEARP